MTDSTTQAMNIEQVKKLAALARLSVSEEQLESVARDVGAIIGFVAQIQDATISEEDRGAIEVQNIFREDIVQPIASVHDLVEAAPLHQDHFVKVPKVIE